MIVGYASVFFYVLAAMTLASGIMVILQRNPVHSAIFLVFTFCCVAGLYITMNAEFLAAVQVLVYAGGIVVLFLFVIMLVPLTTRIRPLPLKQGIAALLLAALLGGAVSILYRQAEASGTSPALSQVPGQGTIETVGMELYTRYLLPFEVASVLLLVAMIGAVVLARRQV